MAAFFIANGQIMAGAAPFRAVRQNSFPAGSKLGQEMSELMPESAIDFFGPMLEQKRV